MDQVVVREVSMVAPNAGPVPGRGLSPGTMILLWIFVGWPVSWLLLFASAPVGLLFGIAITVGMIVAVATSSGRRIAGTGPGGRDAEVRGEVESLASITAIGSCGWCGSLGAHQNDAGYQVHPRHWHAPEIEERIRSRLLG
jgi:hypothetical protein